MQFAISQVVLAALAVAVFGLPAVQTTSDRGGLIWEGKNGTWIENIAVRSNGKLLVTLVNEPAVWEVDPILKSANLVYTFPNANVTLGIAEVEHGVFAVNVGNFSVPGKGVPGSWSIWTLDYRRHRSVDWSDATSKPDSNIPLAKRVAALPDAQFLNGLTALDSEPGTVLSADSFRGLVYAVNTNTGVYSIAIDEPAFKPNASSAITLGINGIHVRNGVLYFSNSLRSPLLGKISLSTNGSASSPVKIIASTPAYPLDADLFQIDDFAIDTAGRNAWIVTNPSGVVVKISLATGQQKVVAGALTDPTFAGATSAAFGRTRGDRDILYVVTDGGAVDPVAAGLKGGTVVALDTAGL
ncbi:hypothetical protein LTR56_016402 [Elasticomyces elasticus]|nr:hypothetical protein LTR56_016402 [Elasticomyces elasticus]KAK3636279.1 hypothetical protein LTR22_018799 [Elasticomyces elasticus]KAK4912054.1 hypothetical protein LTR49_019430 [Elasticomyces elasticus]KAK5751743.1 hypothetical protein LTS12_018157 [Elasticomyces elasticus]